MEILFLLYILLVLTTRLISSLPIWVMFLQFLATAYTYFRWRKRRMLRAICLLAGLWIILVVMTHPGRVRFKMSFGDVVPMSHLTRYHERGLWDTCHYWELENIEDYHEDTIIYRLKLEAIRDGESLLSTMKVMMEAMELSYGVQRLTLVSIYSGQ